GASTSPASTSGSTPARRRATTRSGRDPPSHSKRAAPNEKRLAIHPLHVERIEVGLRRRIYLERGYGERFGVPDGHLAGYVAGLGTRDQLLADCDVILLPKPLAADLGEMREGQVLWGWPHCV